MSNDLPHVWLFSREAGRRLRVKQSLLALALVLGFVALGVWATRRAGSPAWSVGLWAALLCSGQVAMVLAIRSGWSRRFADPALTLPQIVLTLLFTAWVYPMVGSVRAGVFPIFILILCFGMFQLSVRQTMFLALFTLLLVLMAMTVYVLRHPGGVDLHEEPAYLVMMVLSVAGVSVLAGRMARLRRRLQRQREELNAALARLELLASKDTLTGLSNRRHGEELLREALARFARGGPILHVLLIDLDHFKRVNDMHGHGGGDVVLRSFARIALDALRSTDSAVRWGGEEFLLLLLGGDCAVPIERLRLAVAAAKVALPGGGELSFTFSGGLTGAQASDTVETVLERADAALYRAKAAGRDRVEPG